MFKQLNVLPPTRSAFQNLKSISHQATQGFSVFVLTNNCSAVLRTDVREENAETLIGFREVLQVCQGIASLIFFKTTSE